MFVMFLNEDIDILYVIGVIISNEELRNCMCIKNIFCGKLLFMIFVNFLFIVL